MKSGFKDIAKMNKIFERQLDLVNKEITIMNKEASVTNKMLEEKIGLIIKGKLHLIDKEIAIFDGKRGFAIEKEDINLKVRFLL
jgi:hypothetical protein